MRPTPRAPDRGGRPLGRRRHRDQLFPVDEGGLQAGPEVKVDVLPEGTETLALDEEEPRAQLGRPPALFSTLGCHPGLTGSRSGTSPRRVSAIGRQGRAAHDDQPDRSIQLVTRFARTRRRRNTANTGTTKVTATAPRGSDLLDQRKYRRTQCPCRARHPPRETAQLRLERLRAPEPLAPASQPERRTQAGSGRSDRRAHRLRYAGRAGRQPVAEVASRQAITPSRASRPRRPA
jgi:hypothetical protein